MINGKRKEEKAPIDADLCANMSKVWVDLSWLAISSDHKHIFWQDKDKVQKKTAITYSGSESAGTVAYKLGS